MTSPEKGGLLMQNAPAQIIDGEIFLCLWLQILFTSGKDHEVLIWKPPAHAATQSVAEEGDAWSDDSE